MSIATLAKPTSPRNGTGGPVTTSRGADRRGGTDLENWSESMNDQRCDCCIAAVMFAALLLQGCNREPASPPPPAPEVATVTVQPRTIVLTTELPGRTAPYLLAEIRPQVSGLIQKRLFTEGADVKAGDVLYQIDAAPFKAAFDNAAANLDFTRKTADRARAGLAASKASVTRQKATLDLAQIGRAHV